ncbi:MAG: acireductone synthase [Minicystis sp.]
MSGGILLTDIEGTTTDIAFVHQRLFPLARAEMPRFIHAHAQDPEHAASIAAVRRAVAGSARDPEGVTLDEVVDQLVTWIDADAKETALKAIQGAIWREAYAAGGLTSHVYDDVAPSFRRFTAAGARIYVYSSGSIEAQRLLFQHTVAGDLTPYLAGYFDTTTGPKREAASYTRIAAAIGVPVGKVMFVSDVIAELDAARAAGMMTCWMVRPGTTGDPRPGQAYVHSFDKMKP